MCPLNAIILIHFDHFVLAENQAYLDSNQVALYLYVCICCEASPQGE